MNARGAAGGWRGLLGAGALVGVCGGAVGCSTGSDAGPEEGGQHRAATTKGGCACPASGQTTRLSLDCFCAEFPEACPSYEEAKVTTSGDGRSLCFDDSRWWLTEQSGCGRLEISTGWGLGGHRYVYDEVTHELVGALLFSDVPFGACDTAAYAGGNTESCDQGSVCSLCDASGQACAPACSLELMANNGLGPAHYDGTEGMLYECSPDDPAPHPTLHLGCGKVSVVTQFDRRTYAAGTHELLGSWRPTDSECPDGWGAPEMACADEVVCSLCQGDRQQCTAEQLRAP